MLQITNVFSGYKDSIILQDISITVPKQKIVALMGSNGVGKTTLLKTIMGLIPIKSGHIHFGDFDISHYSPEDRASKGIGYVPQGRFIFPYLTVEQNLLVGVKEVRSSKIKEKKEEIYEMFPKLKELLSKYGGNLSGGQQQQLAIARILMMNPSLIIFDEPTEGIQPSIIKNISETIHTISKIHGTAILLVEQYIQFALEHAHAYYILSHGSIVKHGDVYDDNRETIMNTIEI